MSIVENRKAFHDYFIEERYEAGLVSYYEVLDAQRTLLRAEQDLTRINGDLFLSTVLLIKALGGGW